MRTISVFVNGWQAGALQWDVKGGACIPISTEHFKFPRRGANGTLPVPAVNQIEFAADACCVLTVHVGTLTFKAMYPIVLVHGWNAGPWVWGPTPEPADSSICPVNPDKASDGGQNFVQALIDAKVPYDCTLTIKPQVDSDTGAGQLSDGLAPILTSFGVRHVNLIAHSKAGLFARRFLEDNATRDRTVQVGVISLTTLDTPHHGSVLADTVVRFRTSTFGGVVDYLLKLVEAEPGFLGRGADDMGVDSVKAFNDRSFLRFSGPSSQAAVLTVDLEAVLPARLGRFGRGCS